MSHAACVPHVQGPCLSFRLSLKSKNGFVRLYINYSAPSRNHPVCRPPPLQDVQQELAVQILCNSSEAALGSLVSGGLLLLLRDWLRAATEASKTAHVVAALTLLSRLAVNLPALKESKVGAVIMKLLSKATPRLFGSHAPVAALADAIYAKWADAASKNTKATAKAAAAAVAAAAPTDGDANGRSESSGDAAGLLYVGCWVRVSCM